MATAYVCQNCDDEGWVCERHPRVAMSKCHCGGAGQPCPVCNSGFGVPRLPEGFEVDVEADEVLPGERKP